MKVSELIIELSKRNPEHEVVVDIHNHCSDFCSHAVTGLDNGYEPSGVISITIEEEALTS